MLSLDFEVVSLNSPLQKEFEFWEDYREEIIVTNVNVAKFKGKVCDMDNLFKTKPRD